MSFQENYLAFDLLNFQYTTLLRENTELRKELLQSNEEIELQTQKLKEQREQFLTEKKLFIESLGCQTAEVSYNLAFEKDKRRKLISNQLQSLNVFRSFT